MKICISFSVVYCLLSSPKIPIVFRLQSVVLKLLKDLVQKKATTHTFYYQTIKHVSDLSALKKSLLYMRLPKAVQRINCPIIASGVIGLVQK